MRDDNLSLDDQKKDARIFGIITGIALIVALIFSHTGTRALALFFAALFGYRFLFNGATVISMSLSDKYRTALQVTVSILFPLVLSIFFLTGNPSFSFENSIFPIFNTQVLIPLGITAYISWSVGDILHTEHPFRGFVVMSTILFVIWLYRYVNLHAGYYDPEIETKTFDMNEIYISEKNQRSSTGLIFIIYLFNVALSYLTMLTRCKYKTRIDAWKIKRELKKYK